MISSSAVLIVVSPRIPHSVVSGIAWKTPKGLEKKKGTGWALGSTEEGEREGAMRTKTKTI